jgi:hypothetical protein
MSRLPPLSDEREQERQQATMTIALFLDALGEPGWRTVVLQWLAQYEGLERYLWPEDDAAVQVQNLLARYTEEGHLPDAETFVTTLSELPHCFYKASRNGKRWDPLSQTFADFAQGELVDVWSWPHPEPTAATVQSWLLLKYCQTQTHSQTGAG